MGAGIDAIRAKARIQRRPVAFAMAQERTKDLYHQLDVIKPLLEDENLYVRLKASANLLDIHKVINEIDVQILNRKPRYKSKHKKKKLVRNADNQFRPV